MILASFRSRFLVAFFAATTLIIGAAYTLWMVKRVVFGEIGNATTMAASAGHQRREALVLMFAAGVLAVGTLSGRHRPDGWTFNRQPGPAGSRFESFERP